MLGVKIQQPGEIKAAARKQRGCDHNEDGLRAGLFQVVREVFDEFALFAVENSHLPLDRLVEASHGIVRVRRARPEPIDHAGTNHAQHQRDDAGQPEKFGAPSRHGIGQRRRLIDIHANNFSRNWPD